jgi:hypothetical protein
MYFITVLVWSALFFHGLDAPLPIPQTLPSCYDELSVSLDNNCKRVLSLAMVAPNETFEPGSKVVVEDGLANGDTIDFAGRFRYSVVDAQGKLRCGGYILAKDVFAPRLIGAHFITQSLDCQDVNFVLNNPATIGRLGETQSPKINSSQPQTIPNTQQLKLEEDRVKNLGLPIFQDGCQSNKCPVSLKWADQVVYYGCDSIRRNGIWARIYRHWKAFDCAGNVSEVVQEIVFQRTPLIFYQFESDNRPSRNSTLPIETCTPLSQKIPVTSTTPFVYSYFHEAELPRRLYLEDKNCGYTVNKVDFPVSKGGSQIAQVQRRFLISDQCNNLLRDTFRINIQLGDFTPPSIVHGRDTVQVSVQPFACQASILSSLQGLKDLLGVKVADNCAVDTVLLAIEALQIQSRHWLPIEVQARGGVVSGFQQGLYRLALSALDKQGNQSQDTLFLKIVDKIAPVVICDDSLRVAISSAFNVSNGISKLKATDVDEGSYDNCGLRWLRVRRSISKTCTGRLIQRGFDSNQDGIINAEDGLDSNHDEDIDDFGERFALVNNQLYTPLQAEVEFYCCDAGTPIEVELWAEDGAGNRSFCWATIADASISKTTGTISPASVCKVPKDTTLYCQDTTLLKIDNPAYANRVFGKITLLLDTFCPPRVSYSLKKQVKNGEGTIQRIWEVKFAKPTGDSIAVTCQQTIKVYSQALFEAIFPADQVLYCEELPGDTLIFTNLGCTPWHIEVSDLRSNSPNKDECYQILRIYTITNPLAYDSLCADTLAGETTYALNRSSLGNYGREALYFFAETVEDADTLNYYLSLNGDEVREDDVLINGLLPACTTAGDAQSATLFQRFSYTQIIRVIDDERPELYPTDTLPLFFTDPKTCKAEIEVFFKGIDACSAVREIIERRTFVDLFQSGDAETYLSPEYFDAQWFWDKNEADSTFSINIRNVPLGLHNLITVVRDACGNLSVPTILPFEVKDRLASCGGPSDGQIEGGINTLGGAPLPDVKLQLYRNNILVLETFSDAEGNFIFEGLDPNLEYRLVPGFNLNFSNGISTFDLILIQKHILGLSLIRDPYRLIAADVNNSKTLSTLDMIQLRKLILQLDKRFAQNSSWRFVDAGFPFPNPLNPWETSFPEQISIVPLQKKRLSFVAIKVGDPSGNAGQ